MTLEKLIKKLNLDNEYFKELYNYYQQFQKSKTNTEKIKVINLMYQYLKIISLTINSESDLKNLRKILLYCEKNLSLEFITDITPSNNQATNVIEQIINESRQYLFKKNNFPDVDLQSECLNTSLFVIKCCQKYSLTAKMYLLQPAFITNLDLCYKRHYFVIIDCNNDQYLVDLTYSQFFVLSRCLLNRLGLIGLSSPQPGTFMLMNDNRKKIAQKLLKDGYIKLDSNSLKQYLDGFALSYRNGLFYEDTQDFSYETFYSDNDYWHFLEGEDNQLKHENKRHLGYQKEPLKNPYLDFRKR